MTDNSDFTAAKTQERHAAEQVKEAHRILTGMEKHPDLEQAIAKLELALSILTTNTGGML